VYEVELKVRAEHDPVRDRLDALGFDAEGAVVQRDTYYDAPHRDFADTDEALRLRVERPPGAEGSAATEAASATLTYKGPLVDATSKTRREAETTVADAGAMEDVLGALGFEPAATVRKHRETFRADGDTVTLDAVEDLGTFVEAETTVADDGGVEGARDRLHGLLSDLGLDPDSHLQTSYLELLLAD
jgi:adenylate cyclase class 2